MSGLTAWSTARPGAVAPRRTAAALTGALLLPALIPVLAGCTSSGGESAPAAVRAVAAADRAGLAEGGGLTWGVDALPATLNAFQYDADAVTDRIAQAVLPVLFTLDERGRPTLNADFLVSAEVTAGEPRQTVVYTLNPKARWSDGEPIAAADFIAQWKALGGQDNAYWTARNVGYDRIENVEAGPDEGEVLVTFAEPYADWQSLFTPLYPRAVTGEPDAFNNRSRDRLPVAGGPFLVKAMNREKGRIALVRNDTWWGDPALLDTLVFAESERSGRLAALERGELDVVELDPADADRVTGSAGVSVGEAAGGPPAGADETDGRPAAADDAADTRPEAGTESGTDPGSGADPEVDAGTGAEAEAGGSAPAAGPPSGAAAQPPALVRLAEAHLAARQAATAEAHLAAERAAAGYAEAVAAAERARSREFAARERRTAERLSAYTVHRAYDASYTQLALNGTSEALNDERVRWALGRGLDRRALASEVHGPARLPVRPVGSHLWVIGQEGYRDNSAALGEPGTEYAAALLDEAGWRGRPARPAGEEAGTDAGTDTDAGTGAEEPAEDAKTGRTAVPATVPVRLVAAVTAAQQRAAVLRQTAHVARWLAAEDGAGRLAEPARQAGRAADLAEDRAEELARRAAAGVRIKEGRPLQLRFVLPDGPGSAQLRVVAERITGMLGEAGVAAVIEEVDSEAYFSRYVAEGDFDLALYSWPATAFPATDARPVFAKPQSIPGGELFVEQNYPRVGTDHIDQLLDRAAGELDEDRRAELLNKADARIWAVAGSIPLYQSPQLVAAKQDLAGVGAFGLATPRYQDIGYRK